MAIPASSGTYNFLPSIGEVVLNSYARIRIKRAEITEEHMQNARMMTNLLFVDWSVDIPNLWTIDLVSIPLVTGQATYDVDPSTVAILDAYISTDNGDGTTTDIIIYPISRTEYASFPDKSQQGRPTVFWFDRLLSPTITLWNVPDPSQNYTLKFYRAVQIQDANFVNGQQADIPYRFLEAYASGLAAKLAMIYAPDLEVLRTAQAEKAWQKAAQQDVETNVPLYLTPGISGYYR